MGCFFYATPKAMAITQQEALNWVYAQEEKYLDWDDYPPSNPYQCVDLIKYYYNIFGMADYAMGNGYKYATNDLPPGWTRIQNYAEFIPEPGDIGVWTSAVGGGAGHVAIILEADVHTFVSMDQNWPSGSPCSQVSHGYSNFWGVVRPKYDKNSSPFIIVDGASGGEGYFSLSGWAYDPDEPAKQLDIHIYINGDFKGSLTANDYRPDVDNVYHCGAYHGFEGTILVNNLSGKYNIDVAALDSQGGDASWYTASDVTISTDRTKPNISEVNADSIAESSYRAIITVTDNLDVATVKVPTWRASQGGGNATWYNATRRDNKTWVCTVTTGTGEPYYSDVYAYDPQGNEAKAGTLRFNNMTITYNANGGSVSSASKRLSAVWFNNTAFQTYGTLPNPTREGYTFDGWYTAATGGTKITSNSKITTQTNHTLYAHWTANKYTVTFNPNEGSVNPTSNTVTFDAAYGTLPNPTREGYTFDGWYTAVSGGSKVTETTMVKTASNHTLYAHWTANTYTIHYDANGGTGAPADQIKTYGIDLTISDTVPVRENSYTGRYQLTIVSNGTTMTGNQMVGTISYTFIGWNTKADGSGTGYGSGRSYKENEGTTLYAQWRSDTTWPYVKLPNRTRAGYRLLNWNTKADGTGTGYAPGTDFTLKTNTTLYAIWEKLEPDFVLPASLTTIGEEAFAGGAFTYARIPEGTTRIEGRAFADCPNLRHVYIPESATSIDSTAFAGTSGLTIHGKDGSYAEFYASKYGFAFIAE